jgi:hypothetical protein
LRSVLVVGEVSLACLLLIGAGLMLRSFVNLLRADPGFRPEHFSPPACRCRTPLQAGDAARFWAPAGRESGFGRGHSRRRRGHRPALDRLRRQHRRLHHRREESRPPIEEFHARYHVASPGYFRALGIPLVSGRFFTDGDS